MWKAVVLLAALLPFTADGDNSFAAISVQTAMQAQLKAFPRNWHLLDALSSCTTVDTSAVGTVYFAQDYTGGGGIGNLLLKINAGLTFAITNGFEYLIPPMLPFGHNESEMYQHIFPHAKHDGVMMTSDNVLQLECFFKYGSEQRLRRNFPNVTSQWLPLQGLEVIPEAEWKGIPGKRCAPRETLTNCDRVVSRNGVIGQQRVNQTLVIRLPGHLKYHANFTVSAPIFRAAYMFTQRLPFRRKWSHMLAAHRQQREICQAQGHRFAVVGVHIRLGDMAEQRSIAEREALSSAQPDGLRWGTKYVSPRMHVGGLEIVWGIVPPPCTRLIIATDGYMSDPEMQFFFSHLRESKSARSLLQATRDSHSSLLSTGLDQCAENPLHPQALASCPYLFFNRSVISSLQSLNLLAYADVVVASGSQFSRVASMLGGNVILNPNYGYVPEDHIRIPTDLSNVFTELHMLQARLNRDRVVSM